MARQWFSSAPVLLGLVLLALVVPALAEDEAKYDLHDFSLWGLDPTLEQANELQHYPSAMPGVVDTDRSRANEARKLTPLSLITLYGEPVKDLEVDLRVQTGRFVGHWPPAESKSGRLRWLDVATTAEVDKDALFASVDEKHWFNQGRQLEALYLKDKSRCERFLTYDCELKYEAPLQITGGPDTYLITNSGKHPLHDLFVIVPQDDGVRVGRLDSFPPSKAKAAAKPAEEKPAEAKPAEAKPAEEKPTGEKPGEAKPADAKPAETKPSPTKPTEEEPAEAKPADEKPAAGEPAKDQPVEEKVEKQVDAKPAAAAAPVAVPAAAVVAVPAGAAPAAPVAVGPAPPPGQNPPAAATPAPVLEPTELVMSGPLARDSAEFQGIRQTLAANLLKLGLTQAEIDLLLERAGTTLLESKEMIVLFRLPVEAIEERLPLVAYPAPRKTVRTALVAVRNLDPKIKDEVQQLIAQLGATEYSHREQAEKRLTELGRLAVPALKGALKSNDLEIVFRAERILLAQNEKLEGT